MPRFFVDSDQIKDKQIEIIGQDVKHIKNVLRLLPDSNITICDGKGIDYSCKISQIDDNMIKCDIIDKLVSKAEPETKVTLFQSLVKGDKFEWVIQKSIEIGAQEIIPMQTAHCVSKLDKSKKTKSKINRWNKIAQSAAKQSGRAIVPKIADPLSYKEAVKLASGMDLAIIAYEKEDLANLKSTLADFTGKNIGILIGPEGGFSKEEISTAKEEGIKTITLGPRILRSETAGIVLISNILYELGEMDL